MDYKIVLMRDAEENLDRFITYFLFEKKSKPEPKSPGIFLYLEHFATMAQVLFSLKFYIASVSYDNVL